MGGNSSSTVPVEPVHLPSTPDTRRPTLRILLIGIDGSGKTTAAGTLAGALSSQGIAAIMHKNPAGRRTMADWWRDLRWEPGARVLDLLETTARIWNVLTTEARLRGYPGVAVVDRGLACQLALREARGLPRGVVLPWLQRVLPDPDVVVYFDVPVKVALARVSARGTDVESHEGLAALDAGYRRLPEFPGFVRIDAGGSAEDVLEELLRIIVRTGAALPGERVPTG